MHVQSSVLQLCIYEMLCNDVQHAVQHVVLYKILCHLYNPHLLVNSRIKMFSWCVSGGAVYFHPNNILFQGLDIFITDLNQTNSLPKKKVFMEWIQRDLNPLWLVFGNVIH